MSIGWRGAKGRDVTSIGDDADDAAVIAEGISKLYPGFPMPLYSPITSMFERAPFRRRRRSPQEVAGSKDAPAADSGQPTGEDGGDGARGAAAPMPALVEDRRQSPEDEDALDEDEDDADDEDDEGGDDEDDVHWLSKPVHAEPFWALKDVSFRVTQGGTLGVLGERGSGKSILLRILAGAAPPTEGRVLVRTPIAPPPADLAKALSYTARGAFRFDFVLGCRLLGISPSLARRHRDEIQELAPLVTKPDGTPDGASVMRMAVAASVVIPSSVILLEEDRSWDAEFVELISDPLRHRLRSGSSVVLASRNPELLRELCDEIIVLENGSIADRGRAKGVLRRFAVVHKGASKKARIAPAQDFAGRTLKVPSVVPAFNASAAILAATLTTETGKSKRIDASVGEITFEIRLETAIRDVEVRCGIAFVPRRDEDHGIRMELPEPVRLAAPGLYTAVCRITADQLRGGAYQVRADAVVANPEEPSASVIARGIGRVRVASDESGRDYQGEPPVVDWDGRTSRLAHAAWSVEPVQ